MMSQGLNKAMLIGRLGSDPKSSLTSEGKPLSNFSIANIRKWKSKSEEHKSKTEWFNIVAWGNLAEFCNKNLKIGNQVYIEGRIHSENWKDETGNAKSKTEIVASKMIMLGILKSNDNEEGDEYPF